MIPSEPLEPLAEAFVLLADKCDLGIGSEELLAQTCVLRFEGGVSDSSASTLASLESSPCPGGVLRPLVALVVSHWGIRTYWEGEVKEEVLLLLPSRSSTDPQIGTQLIPSSRPPGHALDSKSCWENSFKTVPRHRCITRPQKASSEAVFEPLFGQNAKDARPGHTVFGKPALDTPLIIIISITSVTSQ